MADGDVISDERVAQVLGLYARMTHHVVADPERWLGVDEEPPSDAGIPTKLLDELRDRVFGEKTPAADDWEQQPLDDRVRWWVRRIGLSAGLAAAVPRVAGALASRIPLQAALGASGAGLAVCAVAQEHGVHEPERWVPLLAKVLLDRDLPEQVAADEAATASDAEAEEALRAVPPDEEQATGLGPAARRGVGTIWRLARQIWELQSILDERPRGNFLFRAVAQVPVVGLAGGFLDERGGIKRAAKETAALLRRG